MLYDAYEVQRSLLAGASQLANLGSGWLHNPANPMSYSSMGPLVAASLDVFAHVSAPRGKPEFGFTNVVVGRKRVAVHEEIALRKPFGQLKQALAATALMADAKNPARPLTLTMMGGPVDTREAPTAVNTLATQRPHSWFQQNVIATVPMLYPGAGRKVYPGFLQLAGFMTMNLGSHMVSHFELFKHLVEGDDESADATRAFYDEYRAVCDMTAEFYLQTVDLVFQRHALPKGEMTHRGRRVDVAAIKDTALLAIEGERDDISGIGQTRAALGLAKRLSAAKKQYLLAEGVGHYGIFNGRKWREKIAPVVERFIAANG
ncbi:MAG: polyhydroxyalkanoate depolymerase [Sphingomonadales bacterium]|nr:polyhydroxyalkanoate depolymerase [Sphingomonadales bacterium]